ncbi:MAG: glycosyltransferase family 39 protein [Steroidobacteraceae bacterium]
MNISERLERGCRQLWRPGQHSPRDTQLDIYWLLILGLLLMAVGIGLRDPWPADEPRFALIARDMVRSGQWLIPMVGGDTYADKPPVFFWLIASVYWLTGSLRIAFLLPSLLASLVGVVLVYDLGRRLWNREVGLAAGLLLLGTIQFVWQGRLAQIDAVSCCWIVLGLYGLLRHLLLGPNWRWYYLGCAAAGLGVITKGVGFLPLLILIPYFLLRGTWSPRPILLSTGQSAWRWALGPVAMLAAICLWFVPMMLASLSNPELAAYRDEILFKQTIDRYSNSWIHVKPFWYFFTEVIPPLWLPASALIPWAVPSWRSAWRERDLRIGLLLSWVLLVVLFFSFSTGKRGVYVLPALPAFCLVLAPVLVQRWSGVAVRRVLFGLASLVGAICLLGGIYALLAPALRAKVLLQYGIDAPAPLLSIGIPVVLLCWLARTRNAGLAWLGTLAIALAVVGLWINPAMNEIRSSEAFVRRVEAATRNVTELGWVAYGEENLLMARRPIVNFGHARWREWDQEADDAAAWLMARPGRQLLIDEAVRQRCFAQVTGPTMQDGLGQPWFLVAEGAESACVQRGHVDAALLYDPPGLPALH